MQVSILGPLDVVLDDGRHVSVGSARQRALLARLALDAGRAVPADLLTEELWAGNPPPSASNALQVFVSRLRRAIGADIIVTGPGGYMLAVDPGDVDAARFERLGATGRDLLDDGDPERAATVLREALDLWRGHAFADVTGVPGCEREATRLAQARLRVLEDRLEADLACGRHAEVTGELETLVAEHPFREEAWAKLMLARYRSGRQADALDAAAQLRRILAEELGIDPSADVRRLEEAILHQKPELDWTPPLPPAPPTSPAPPSRVPEPITSFVGRDRELADVHELLRTNRLVTLTGFGGAGKTRLALAVASDWDHAWVVEFAGVTDPELVGAHVAAVLGVPDVQAGAGRIGDRQGLLVLDNAEHLLSACSAVARELLAACPGLRVVATSREPLGAGGEAVYRVGPLTLPAAGDADPLASDAAQLFCERARAVDASLRPEDHAEAIADICRRLDGMPLALELAAARSTVLAPADIRARVGRAAELLATRAEPHVSHHASLGAALDWSYNALRDTEQTTFRTLAVFAGGLTLSDAESVCGRAVLDDVERLVAVSLLDRVPSAGAARFRMLEPVRALAEQKLRAAGEELQARRRLFERMRQRFADVGVRVSGPGGPEAAAELESEDVNLQASLTWALEEGGDPEGGMQLAVGLSGWWQLSGRVAEARRWLAAVIAANGHRRDRDVALARIALGAACFVSGDVSGALTALESGLEVAREVGDRRTVCQALVNLGAVTGQTQDLARARQLLEEGHREACELGEDGLRMRALNNLAPVVRRTGDPAAARNMYEQALGCAREIGDRAAEVATLLNIGEIDRMAGRLDDALDSLTEALDGARAIGYGPGISAALGGLGNVAHAEGDLVAARARFEESVDVARELGIEPLRGAGVANLAAIAEDEGNLVEARQRYTEYLRSSEQMGDERGRARAWRGLADVLRAEGQPRRSSRFLARALRSSAAMADGERIAECLASAAELASAMGHDDIAVLARARAEAPAGPDPETDETVARVLDWLSEPTGSRRSERSAAASRPSAS